MDYIVAAGLLVCAVLTIAVGRLVLNRPGVPHEPDAFGAAEAIAFVFTVLLSVAVSLMAAKALDEATLASVVQMIAALMLAGVASGVAWVALGRLARRAPEGMVDRPIEPRAPGRERSGRPSGPAAGARSRLKRAA